jgi:hypothetical protein|tara:strand:- start:5068 stop:5379 length:312 start_codon:yes stop_codon:yes gene_type:complete
MKKISLASILILILFTSLIKNSTKKIEDNISILRENTSLLKLELGDVMLEYNYLSSPEKLMQYQSQYFESELIKIDITKIKKITIESDIINITEFINKNIADE